MNNIISEELVNVYLFNGAALAVTFSGVESVMKILVLTATLIYTSVKIYQAINGSDKGHNK